MKKAVKDIGDKLLGYINTIRSDSKLMSKIYVITLAAALLVLAVVIKGPEQKGRIITDKYGNASAIERHSAKSSEKYDFELEIKDAGELIVKEVELSLQAIGNEKSGHNIGTEVSREAEIDAAVDSVVNEVEFSKSKRVLLPDVLRDGTEIKWKAFTKKDHTALFLIPAVYAALLVFVIRSSGESDKADQSARRRSIMRGLPRFCNQLFLMMNAGLILSDAFELISGGYEAALKNETDSENMDYFERELAAMHGKNEDHRKSTASMVNEFAVNNDVKEMIRIATILTENEKRGSDVIESLSRESRYLWDERKIVARENGKMIDTKMSYPLGILLILLIVITMAPAMLSM